MMIGLRLPTCSKAAEANRSYVVTSAFRSIGKSKPTITPNTTPPTQKTPHVGCGLLVVLVVHAIKIWLLGAASEVP